MATVTNTIVFYWLNEMYINVSTYPLINVNSPAYKPQSPYGMGNIPAPNRPAHYYNSPLRVIAIITDATDQFIIGVGVNGQATNTETQNSYPGTCAELNAYQSMQAQAKTITNPSKIYIKSTNTTITPFKSCLQQLATYLPNIIVVLVSSDPSNKILLEAPISTLI